MNDSVNEKFSGGESGFGPSLNEAMEGLKIPLHGQGQDEEVAGVRIRHRIRNRNDIDVVSLAKRIAERLGGVVIRGEGTQVRTIDPKVIANHAFDVAQAFEQRLEIYRTIDKAWDKAMAQSNESPMVPGEVMNPEGGQI